MKKMMAMIMALLGYSAMLHAEVYPNTNVEVVKSGVENAHEAIQPEFKNNLKDTGIQPRDMLFAPPVVPHSIKGMQVSKNTNRCLECHNADVAQLVGATVPSKTHFYDREGHLGDTVSARRYFCLQCHVPQTDAKPIVEQTYRSTPGYDRKADQPLPQVTKTPEYKEKFEETLKEFGHSSDKYLNQHH